MTRKDYELIAAALHRSSKALNLSKRATARHDYETAIRLVAIDLCATLAYDNPRFDKAIFMKACGFNF